MPGLIDMHAHILLQKEDATDAVTAGARGAQDLHDYLQQGFTTVRDAGGATVGLAQAVAQGQLTGPRIFSSGPLLTTNDSSNNVMATACHGPTPVLQQCRQQLQQGATQLCLAAGGAVTTEDPLHVTHFTVEEMTAAVQVAEDYGTYVMAVCNCI